MKVLKYKPMVVEVIYICFAYEKSFVLGLEWHSDFRDHIDGVFLRYIDN